MAHRRLEFEMPAEEAVVFDAFHFHHWRRQAFLLHRAADVRLWQMDRTRLAALEAR